MDDDVEAALMALMLRALRGSFAHPRGWLLSGFPHRFR
jgi:hypothetical protein